MRKLCAASLFAVCAGSGLAACGGDGNDVEPELIPGGGIHDPGIDGEVNVHVIDEDTDAPIVGATVRVGTVEGSTDAAGLFTASGDLVGKQTIVVKATNYAPSVWVGADGANVTVPMTRATTTSTNIPQAELAGTITGWDQLPAPAMGHAHVALVTYSQSKELSDDSGNDLPPPAMNSNVCISGPQPAACNWRINARAGTIAVAAALADYDSKNTPAQEDDTVTITNFALLHPVTVVDGANQTGLALAMLPANSTTSASVTFGTPPSTFTNVAGIVGVDLGDLGVLRISQVTPTMNTVVVPSLSAVSGAAGYELLGFAAEPVDDGTAGQSIVIRRGITNPSGIAAGEWLAAPTGLASDRATVSLSPNASAKVHIIEINTNPTSGTGNRAMSIAIFDDTTTVELPVDFAPLPAGSLVVTANDFDAPGFDPQDFEVDSLIDSIERLASESIIVN
ncbi:MAG: carboxypeptidase-like regulatory domain-containing protein [Kofleriaceae bacterium]|nr:MAG: carboxypeptidase-like regulatory domain-containing protein [Kofleriaceae bacterium]MBZ0237892.1 carboxypeptidase-like regulatory domain-containing protein [Kofleriaceae bacterium]